MELFSGIRISVQYFEHTYTTPESLIIIYFQFHCKCVSCASCDKHTPAGLPWMWQVFLLGLAPAPALGPLLYPLFLGIHPKEAH